MIQSPERQHRHREAKSQLNKINRNRNSVLVIHYSCEGFYDRPGGRTSRIVSIAVRNLETAETKSFSVLQIAERDKKLPSEDIKARYEEFEKEMLEEFYDYAKNHRNHTWLHWNMRSITYGFAALEHRCKVLGGEPFEIQESRRCNLAQVLDQLYGVDYIDRPHLENLIKENSITDLDFLSGEDEAKGFENGKYPEMHRSTERKVAVISDIADRASDNTLITKVQLTKNFSGRFAGVIEKIKKHWLVTLLFIIGAIASILTPFVCG